MRTWEFGKHKLNGAVVTATILALVGAQPGLAQSAPDTASYGANSRDGTTSTPIKHVIIIIGENRTFDNVFATYAPQPGNTVWNLLSEGIVNPDGAPGPNYSKALQSSALPAGAAEDPLCHAASLPGRRPVHALWLSADRLRRRIGNGLQ